MVYFQYLIIILIDSVISRNRDQWIPIIESTYPENISIPNSKIVVCDLHFETNSITHLGSKKNLIADAVPKLRCIQAIHIKI